MIEAEKLGFRYGGTDWIFRDHSFRLPRGAITAILGPNGRGKTTLLKCILGLIRPTEGRLAVDGVKGYVPQNLQSPFPYKTFDIVLMGRARHIGFFRHPTRADHDAARDAMARLSILDLADRPFDRLSAGQQQLALIARALASRCDLLVLDEPASALDFRNQAKVLQALARLSGETGLTVVFTTHAPQHALSIAQSALLMFGGATYRHGPVDVTVTDENLEALYEIPVRNLSFQHDGRSVRTVAPVLV
jgi:iron complex transport system ATP-binding protein